MSQYSAHPAVANSNRIRIARWLIPIAILAVLVLIGTVFSDWYRSIPLSETASFVGRDRCIDCHQQQAKLFHGSHHDLAMDVATDKTVRADFDNASLDHFGITSRFFRRDGKFMVHTEGPDGELADFEIKYVFGYEPLQQYMVEFDRPPDAAPEQTGRLQVLRLCWDTEANRWFYLSPSDDPQKIDPGDPLHWTGITQCWNSSCADCHSTNLEKNYDLTAHQYRTTWSEIDVSCEACHGPGSLHVDIAESRWLFWDRNHGTGLVALTDEDPTVQVEACAKCHSRRRIICNGFVPGKNFHDHFAIELITEPTYHADGQIRDEDYVYGSFLQSKMYHQGIRCTDCHDPHSTKVKHSGNQLCTSCHAHPAGKYDTPEHHHHLAGFAGALCVECHMPETTYMEVDPRRDHSLRVPRPDLSVKYNVPNACTKCHLDRAKLPDEVRGSLKQYLDWIIAARTGDTAVEGQLDEINRWAATTVEQWYPKGIEKGRGTSYYEWLAHAGRLSSDEERRSKDLQTIIQEPQFPTIVRASAARQLAELDSDLSLAAARTALEDEEPQVVTAALDRYGVEFNSLADRAAYVDTQTQRLDLFRETIADIQQMLARDDTQIRMAVVRACAAIPLDIKQTLLSTSERARLDESFELLRDSLMLDSDRKPASHLMLASLYQSAGDLPRAITHYRHAIRLEPQSAGARTNLASILENRAATYQMQARQLASQNQAKPAENLVNLAVRDLAQAAKLRNDEHEILEQEIKRSRFLEDNAVLHYRYAMSAYLRRDLALTEKHLKIALDQQPENQDYRLAMATFLDQQERYSDAIRISESLTQQHPDHLGYQRLLDQLKRKAAAANGIQESEPTQNQNR